MPTTFKEIDNDERFETLVGDEKQEEFFPRVKIKKWANEANFSLGMHKRPGVLTQQTDLTTWEDVEKTIKFINRRKHVPLTNEVDHIHLGEINPKLIPAEFELFKHIRIRKLTIITYAPSRDFLMAFGQGLSTTKLGVDHAKLDVPLFRADSHPNNLSYMTNGFLLTDLHAPNNKTLNRAVPIWEEAKLQVLNENLGGFYSRNSRIRYLDAEGNELKASSPEWNELNYWDYLNYDCPYEKSKDYYTSPENHAYRGDFELIEVSHGIKVDYPAADKNLQLKIVEKFVELSGMTLNTRTLTPKENSKLIEVANRLDVTSWKRGAKRPDLFVERSFDDGFEIDVIYKQKPVSNVVPFTIRTKDLDFFKQPDEFPEDVQMSANSPDLLGSYAVYSKSNSQGAYLGGDGDKYRGGKVLHIYRPFIEDVTGRREWCDMDIDETNNLLNVTIPQDFYDNGVLPWRLDPAMGKTGIGGTNSNFHQVQIATQADTAFGLRSIMTVALGSITFRTNPTNNFYKTCVMKRVGDTGTSLIPITGIAEQQANGTAWYTTSVNTAADLESADAFQVVAWGGQVNGYNMSAWYDIAGSAIHHLAILGAYTGGDYPTGWANPTTLAGNTRRYSIYATYDFQWGGGMSIDGGELTISGVSISPRS